jgi:DNA polymerase-3 subunit beta
MKFTASSADLQDALTTVGRAVPSKSTMPILECILFERDEDGHLRLSVTDLEISIVKRVPVQFESNGTGEGAAKVAVPAKRLQDTIRALPDLPLTFEADEEFEITMTTDQGHYQMVGHDGADYPELPELEGTHTVTTDGVLLQHAIEKTRFAVSQDALRPAMMGVYFQLEEDSSRVVATDGHRLVKLELDDMTSDEDLDFIVPEKALGLARRVAEDEMCTLAVGDGHVSFDFGNARILARLIDEQYPNYDAVIPDGNDKLLTADREALLNAVKRVGLYSSSMTNQIRMALSDDQVEISAEDIERSSEARETVLCEYDEDDMEIGFNANYLTEVLGNMDAEEVVFAFSTPNRAGIVRPQDQDEGEDVMMLIMPVMLNTYA